MAGNRLCLSTSACQERRKRICTEGNKGSKGGVALTCCASSRNCFPGENDWEGYRASVTRSHIGEREGDWRVRVCVRVRRGSVDRGGGRET